MVQACDLDFLSDGKIVVVGRKSMTNINPIQ
jgi:hypothetical protein